MKRRRRSPSRRKPLIIALIVVAVVTSLYVYSQVAKQRHYTAKIEATTPAARNDIRKRDLVKLASAIKGSYRIHGKYEITIPHVETAICDATSENCRLVRLVDLNQLITDGLLLTIPSDPSGGPGHFSSGYSLYRRGDGRIILRAPRTEGVTVISETI